MNRIKIRTLPKALIAEAASSQSLKTLTEKLMRWQKGKTIKNLTERKKLGFNSNIEESQNQLKVWTLSDRTLKKITKVPKKSRLVMTAKISKPKNSTKVA